MLMKVYRSDVSSITVAVRRGCVDYWLGNGCLLFNQPTVLPGMVVASSIFNWTFVEGKCCDH